MSDADTSNTFSTISILDAALTEPNSFVDGDWVESQWIVNSGIRLIQTGNIGVGVYLDKGDRARYIAPSSFGKLRCKWVRPGDILICRLADPIGRACIVPDELGKCITSVDCTIYRPDPKKLHSRYALHLLNSDDHLKKLNDSAGGSTRQRISRSALGASLISIPDISVQSIVATILDTIDNAIRHTDQIIEKLHRVKAGLLHDLLTCGLDENGELRDPIRHPEQFKDSLLGRIPKEWEVDTLGLALLRNSGFVQTGPFGSQLHANEYTTDGTPVIMPQDISDGRFIDIKIARIPSTRANDLRRHRVETGDLIFARRGDLSRCAAVTEEERGWLCGTGCMLMRFSQTSLIPEWLSLVYRHDIGQRQVAAQAVGSTMVNLNTQLLHGLLFAFPNKHEQSEVVLRLDQTEASIGSEVQQLGKLSLLKQGLMRDLLTGKVPVTEGTVGL